MTSDQMGTDEDTLKRASDDDKLLAIVTIDVAEAFHSELTGLLRKAKEIITEHPDFVNSYRTGCQNFKGLFARTITTLFYRLSVGKLTRSNPFIGRMHFQYSEVRSPVMGL